MRNAAVVLAAGLAILLATHAGLADPGNPVGISSIVVPPNTDVYLSPGFTQVSEGDFVVSTKGDSTHLTVTNTFTLNQYAATYYVRFTSGGASGLWTTITANTVGPNSQLTLESASVGALFSAGDSFRIYKHWTPATLFPAGLAKDALGNACSFLQGSIIAPYSNVDLSPAAFVQNKPTGTTSTRSPTAWSSANTLIIRPDTMVKFRNASTTTSVTVITAGQVPDYTVSMLIAPTGDLCLGTGYPVPVLLKNAGLGGTGTGRIAYFYDNARTGQNNPASVSYTCNPSTGLWTTAGGNTPIPACQGIKLRLPSSVVAGTKVTIPKPY